MIAILLGILIVLLLLGYPMKVPLIAASFAVLLLYYPEVEPAVLAQQMIGGVKPSALVAVPMFILAADIMTRGQAANRLLDLVSACVGHLRGGLPITSAIGST